MVNLITQLAVMQNTMKTLSEEVQEVTQTSLRIATGRPSWAMTTLLTLLSSSVVGLSVEVIHLLTKG